MTPEEVAQWMADELVRTKWLDQSTAVWQIHQRDKELTYMNNNGNLAFVKEVLAEFKKLTKDQDVVWSRSTRQWRFRQTYDKPGRMQD